MTETKEQREDREYSEHLENTDIDTDSRGTVALDPDAVIRERVADVLGVGLGDLQKYTSEFDKLIEFAKKQGATTSEDYAYEIRHLYSRIGREQAGDDRVKYLARYVYLLGERQQIDKEIIEIENA